MDHQQEARRIVREIWKRGLRTASFEDPRTPEFANAALSELIARRKDAAGVFEEVLEGADFAANQLAIEDTHGLMELVQNADDQGASKIRFGVRRKSSRWQLVVAHNGDPITVSDAVAMCFAFLSTKRGDPKMTGKFGIGLKTLSRLADRFEVHCSPYHFAIVGNKFEIARSPHRSKFYDPHSTDTLFVLPLRNEDSVLQIRHWVKSWYAGNMLFLNNLRELLWVHPSSGKVGIACRLTETKIDTDIPWKTPRRMLSINQIRLNNRGQGKNWVRYDAEIPVPKRLSRAFKATGATTTVSVAVPSNAEANVLYAGLPTKIPLMLPYVIGAAFDTNTARTQVQQVKWNQWLWKQVAGLVTTLVLHLLQEAPTKAWQLIPSSDEAAVPADGWIEKQIEDLRIEVCETVRRKGRIATKKGPRKLSMISYEEDVLDGLLTIEDCIALAPKHTPLPSTARDSEGRWRRILHDIEIGRRIDVLKALDLLPPCTEQPLVRSPEWYIRLVCEALDAGLQRKLNDVPCVLVDDPVELLAPNVSGSLFSTDDTLRPLASRLRLVRKLHGSLHGEGRLPGQIREWLEALGRLRHRLDATTVLEAIAGRGVDNLLEIHDDALVELRDLIDEVDEPDKELLLRVGQSILIDAYQWIENRRVTGKMSVYNVYLPPSMSEADGWPRAAAHTSGLHWAAPRYVKLLDPGDRQSGQSGARRFLASLGALNVFRLMHRPNREVTYEQLPTLQYQAFQQFLRENREFHRHQHRPRSLRDDYISPDLESVVEDMCSSHPKERYERGLALVKVLDRNWRRSLQQRAFCLASYSHYGKNDLGDVRATWIAKLAEYPWLYNGKRQPAKPLELSIRYPLTQGLFGDAESRFAAGIQDNLAPGLAEALGLEVRPKISVIISVLAQLRASGEHTDWSDVRLHYAHLESFCPDHSSPVNPKTKIDDMTVGELRGRFGINPRAQGLIATNEGWKAPTAVRQGRHIFGHRRSFVPTKGYENLWHVLGIREPKIGDCVAVLKEIAMDGDAEAEANVLIDTFRHLNKLLEAFTLKERRALATVPLWSGSEWATRRPIYYIADETASQSLATTHTMWHPPCSLEGMDSLVEALGVTHIPPENCTPTGVGSVELRVGEEVTDQFSSTVKTLQDFLAKNEPEAYRHISIGWTELSKAAIAVAPRLGLEISLPDGEQVDAKTDAHIIQYPLTVCVRDEDLLYDYHAGGRVISHYFGSEHRQMVRLAWSNPNVMNQGIASATTLADDVPPEEDPLAALKSTVKEKLGKPLAGKRLIQPLPPRNAKGPIAEPRRLKALDLIRIKNAVIVNPNAPPGKRLPRRKTPPAPKIPKGHAVGTHPNGGVAPADYTSDEKEQFALKVLESVVQNNKGVLKDFTRIRGLGADAGDDLGRLFEMKAHGGEMPDSVNIELSQRRAANESPEKFYLAVISGLEEGYDEIVVKLFSRPMQTLNLEKGTSMKLSGVMSKRALEVRLGSE